MSLDLPLDALKLQLASQIDKDEFIGTVVDIKLKKDTHGRDCLQLIVESKEYGKVVIALSPSYINVLVDNLKRMGFQKLSDILGITFKFKRIKLQKAKANYTDPYPRFIPVEIATEV